MFVDVELESKVPAGLSVTIDSVIDDGRNKVVFVSSRPGVFKPRVVTTGLEYNGRVQVLGGLRAGESVVSSGMFLLDSESRLQSANRPEPVSLNEISAKQPGAESPAVPSHDPVCGMPLSGKAEESSVYHGSHYRFCSKDCKDKFDQNPPAYTKKSSDDQSKDGAQS
jgi:YHS domain-containing protein